MDKENPSKEPPIVEVIARGVLVHRGSVLICRDRKRGHAFLPGGHVEFGETAAAALEREMSEELGVSLRSGRFLGVCEASFVQASRRGRRRHHEINLVFELVAPKSAVRAASRARGKSGGGATDWLRGLASIEAKIEFIWVPLGHLRGRRPRLRLLPPGLTPLIVPAPAPGSANRKQPGIFCSDWR
jgi:ADP-ribose pyrophosphatase YjhB (NUDIX family)